MSEDKIQTCSSSSRSCLLFYCAALNSGLLKHKQSHAELVQRVEVPDSLAPYLDLELLKQHGFRLVRLTGQDLQMLG